MKKNIYKTIYSDEKNLGNLADSFRIRNMITIIDKLNPKNKNILDIGCYDGTFLALIKNRNNNFFGLDASDWAIAESQKKDIKSKQYFFDDITRFPYEDGYFDIIAAGEIIEHIYDTDFFLEEIRRVLKPKGKLLISTPNIASLGRRLLLFLGINPIIEVSPNESDSSGHIRYFTFSTLQKILRKHNFKVILYHSDCMNFSKKGLVKSAHLAKIFPKLGASIIILAEKT